MYTLYGFPASIYVTENKKKKTIGYKIPIYVIVIMNCNKCNKVGVGLGLEVGVGVCR